MPLTRAQLNEQKIHFEKRTGQFAEAGYDRLGAPEFILDQAGDLDGPVLDVGTGTGITARALANRGLDVVTVDLSADDQEVAAFLTDDPGVARRIRYMRSDAARLPVPDHHFSAAVVVDALHHLDAGAPVLRELLRVVSPGGIVVLADFTAEGFAMVSRIHAEEGREHPEGPVTLDWARRFLAGQGAAEVTRTSGHLHEIAVLRTPATGSRTRACRRA